MKLKRHRKARSSTVVTALGAAVAVSVLLPTVAAGDPVGDVLGGLGVGAGNGGGGGTVVNNGDNPGGADNRAGTPPNYQPPLHGTNPHGEGTVAAVEINPSNTNPYPGGPQGGNEEIVVGDSRGEQNGGAYHGRVTLIYVNPLGIPIANVFIETNPGEARQGPTAPLNSGPLTTLCTNSGGNACMQILPMDSSTTSTDSSNLFAIFRGSFLQGRTTVNLGTSSGQIQEGGGCQTASGTSSIANGNVGGVGAFDVLSASSSSTACNNGAQSTQNSSTFLNLFGVTPSLPFLPGCANLVANSSFVLGPLGLVCHANDANGGQTSNPYGVREAVAAFVTVPLPLPSIRAVVSGPESHAVAPPAPPTPGSQGQGGTKGKAKGGGEDGGAAAGEVAAEVLEGRGGLPLTGENVLLLALIGTGLVGLGLLGAAASRRRTV